MSCGGVNILSTVHGYATRATDERGLAAQLKNRYGQARFLLSQVPTQKSPAAPGGPTYFVRRALENVQRGRDPTQ